MAAGWILKEGGQKDTNLERPFQNNNIQKIFLPIIYIYIKEKHIFKIFWLLTSAVFVYCLCMNKQ